MRSQDYKLLIGKLPSFLLAALLSFLSLGASPFSPARATTTYLVNSVVDAPDADPSDGICAAGTGLCTLRAAIMEANFTAAADTINLPAGVYLLTRMGGNDDSALVGDLDIIAPLTIQGAGAGVTIVDGNGAVIGDRVFHELDSAQTVSLSGITIRNGTVPINGTAGIPWGGGILVVNNQSLSPLTLNLSNVILEGNSTLTGGGLYLSAGTVVIQNSVIRNNATISNGAGGGIFAGYASTLTLRDSQVYGNTANSGGGMALEGMADTHIVRSEFYANTVNGFGGAIYNISVFAFPFSPLTIEDSRIHNNTAAGNGGAIATHSSLILTRSLLDANQAGFIGGGVYANPTNTYTLTFQQSTISNNSAQYGGGIGFESYPGTPAPMTLVNSTLSGNQVSADGGGIYAVNNAKIELYNVTIANNVLSRVNLGTTPMRGGGVFFGDTAVITAGNMILANNYYTNYQTPVTPDDCYNTQVTNSLHSLGFNLIETTSNCLISGTTFGNVNGQDPLLGPLAYNLGSTPTHALLPGSPAIDVGQTPSCTGADGAAIFIDQRGLARPNGPRCDIGAVEYYPIHSVFLPRTRR